MVEDVPEIDRLIVPRIPGDGSRGAIELLVRSWARLSLLTLWRSSFGIGTFLALSAVAALVGLTAPLAAVRGGRVVSPFLRHDVF